MKSSLYFQPVLVVLISFILGFTASPAGADIEEDPVLRSDEVGEKTGFFIEYFNYQEYVYSKSKKTELGDNVEVDTALRYQFGDATFGRVRFETDPVQNRAANKTSQVEFLAGHRVNNWYFQVDVEVRGDDTSTSAGNTQTGETSIGLDLDSHLTKIMYVFQPFDLIFYPFNFDGEVGREFNTWDVTRLYFIEGSPSSFPAGPPTAGESIAEKTIPGLELGMSFSDAVTARAYVGVGAASYLYPTDPSFEIDQAGVTASRWERQEDIGYKAGFHYRNPEFRLELEYVGHTQADETGSLLKEAASLYMIGRVSGLLIEPEIAYSHAGSRAYRLSSARTWFEETTPFDPLYQDYSRNRQDWLGESDLAYHLRVGIESESFVPYVSYKYQGKHFIFRERESAHRLRVADESASHGGLSRYGLGAFFYNGNFLVNPHFEFLQARNPVFYSSTDVRADRLATEFKKQDYLLYLTVSYSYGPSRVFRP